MNIAIVLSKEMPGEIAEACKSNGDVLYESAGTFDGEGLKKAFHSVARLPVDVLVTDTDVASEDGLLAGLHAFRFVRPEARVVLLVNRRQPGDDLVSGAVSLGIYDIIEADGENKFLPEFAKCLTQGYSYAKAAAWHKGFREEAGAAKAEAVVIEKTIGTGMICIGGVRRGAGSTTTAVAVAHYLAKQKKSVAYIELSQRPVAHRVTELFNARRITVFAQHSRSAAEGFDPVSVIAAMTRLPDYIVMDMGALLQEPGSGFDPGPRGLLLSRGVHPCFTETCRADLVLLTLGTTPWGAYDLAPYQARLDKHLRRWDVLVMAEHARFIGKIGSKRVHNLPWTPDPFEPPDDWATILAPVLPQSSSQRPWAKWWPRKISS